MKLSPRDATAYFRKPDSKRAGLLIFGADPMRVATRRKQLITALIGKEGEAEMRLTRIAAADLRKDPALLNDAVKAQGFFPGPRAALVEDATDGTAPVLSNALADWLPGDAQIIVTAGQLTARAALRKLFEAHPNALAAALYDEPPSRDEIEAALTGAGLHNLSSDAMGALTVLSRSLDPGDFRQTVEKLGLYKHADASEVTVDDIEACAPQSAEAALDDLLSIVCDARTGEIAQVLRRLYAQGVTPVSLCIGANRHFRALHTAASDPGGPGSGIARMRPPVFGPRRDMMVRQASAWGLDRLEKALGVLLDTDLQLRSSTRAPQQALVERSLIRLAMMARR
jgi:DNA polymerase III subunit delta